LRVISSPLADFMMGFGLFWNAQFHMSWVILLPFVLLSLYFQFRSGALYGFRSILFFALGSISTGLLILPTVLKYGLSQGSGGTEHSISFNPANLNQFLVVLARFLSLASCEIPRFIGSHLADRLEFLRQNPWIAPFTVAAALLGFIQTGFLLYQWFQPKHPAKDWPFLKNLTLFTFLLIYASFLFAIKAPAAHTYYLTLPLVMLYGFYCFSPLVSNRLFLNAAKVLLVCNIVFHAGLAINHFPTKSLYKDRELFVKAIQEKNYHLLGERRPDTLY